MSQHTHTHPQGGIRRGPRLTENFTVMQNRVLNDERLTFRARGVLSMLLSKPEEWKIRSDAIARTSPGEGREAIRTVMRELIAVGYMVREKYRNEDGHWITVQTIYEVPVTTAEVSVPPAPRKANVGRPRDGKTGAFTKNPSPRTETNNNPAPQAPASLGDALATVSSSEIGREELKRNRQKIAELEDATLAAGLPASYSRIKPEQKKILLELIDRHGTEPLAQAAVRAHRPANPTMHVHGWIRLWTAMSVRPARKDETPSPAQYNSAKCPDCDDIGMVLNEDDLGVPCHCRAARSAA